MSTQTQTSVQSGRSAARNAVVGNTARALAPERARPAERRLTPLAVVPAAAGRRRLPFSILCIIPLALALGLVLVLNISVSGGQYELVKLRNQQVALEQSNEKLTQQVENLQAPQNLAAKAAELGMVNAAPAGSIDLSTLSIAGRPAAAAAEQKPTALVAAPAQPGQPRAAAPVQPESRKAATAAPAAVEAEAEAAARSGASAGAGAAAGAGAMEGGSTTAGASDVSGTQPQFTSAELNGGSIPAPKQKTGR